MIELKQVRWRNFLSYGQPWTNFTFEKGITRITGMNGNGKSTLVDVVHYALFGKPFRKINIPRLINSKLRKNLEVQMELTSRGQAYTVVRGIKPDRFEIYHGEISRDNLIDQNATKAGYQQFFESDVLRFNEDIFQQIGIKSLTRHDSFLTLPKAKKRQIIEHIFGIEVLSEMRDINKLKIDELEYEIYELQNEVDNYSLLISQEMKNIDKLRRIQEQLNQDLEAENQKKRDEIKDINETVIKCAKALSIIHTREKEIEELEAAKTAVKEKARISKKDADKYSIQIKVLESNVCFVKEKCPTCPNLDKMEDEAGAELIATRDELLSKSLAYEARVNDIESEQRRLYDSFKSKKMALVNKQREAENQIHRIETTIRKKPKVAVDVDNKPLKEYENKKAGIEKKIKKRNETLKYYKVVFGLLQDDGIKTYIIRKYLPIINKLMNTYLQRFRIDLEMKFNSDLEIQVGTKFKEGYQYENFSEGEKKRINLALTFTFLEFCKLKYSNSSINVLMLDEFSIGLDSEGEYDLYTVLKDIVEAEDKEIITISPIDSGDLDRTDRLFTAKVEKGFSMLEMVEVV